MATRKITINKISKINAETIRSKNVPEVIRYLDTSSITKNTIENVQILDSKIAPFPSRAQRKVKNKTIIYSTVRPEQEHFGIIESDTEDLIVSSGFLTLDVIDKDIDPKYLYYLITKRDITNHLQRVATNNVSAYPSINPDDLGKMEFVIPEDVSTQQKIAAVLSALDAKIELNQRINAELESMAKTLYDYWFVHNKNVGKLKVGKLGDFIKVNERSITKDYPHSEIEYIDIASVSVGRLEGTTQYALKDAPSRARRLVKHGDTIWSTVRPNRKSYLFICNPKENLVVSTGFAVLTPKNIPPSFLYFLTTTEQFVNYLVSNSEGSAYPAVSADRFAELEFSIPPEKRLTEFENIVSPMLTKISQLELESQTLTVLRDWLLPMLMNGQVVVRP